MCVELFSYFTCYFNDFWYCRPHDEWFIPPLKASVPFGYAPDLLGNTSPFLGDTVPKSKTI